MPGSQTPIDEPQTEAWNEWISLNSPLFETRWERLFAMYVLARVTGLRPDQVDLQRTVHVTSGAQRRIDFAVQAGEIRLAIEVDGFDKKGAGGPSAKDLRATSERDMELRQQGWTPFHVANSTLQHPASREKTILALERELDRAPTSPKPASEDKPAMTARRVLIAVGSLLAAISIIGLWATGGNPCRPGAQTWTEAEVGAVGVFSGPVARIGSDQDTTTMFIDIGRSFPDPTRLTAVIFDPEASGLGFDANTLEVGQVVCVTGNVQAYAGGREIVVDSASQLSVNQ